MDMMQIIISAAALVCIKKKKQRQRRRRRWWVRPIYSKRYLQGDYNNLIQEMRLNDHEMFFNYTRMTVELFDNLLAMVGPLITKHSNRPSIPASARLACTLRFLAAGDCLQTLAFSYRMSKSSVCKIVKETCDAIWTVLQPVYLTPPNCDEWKQIAYMFNTQWNLPNCVGAIDGKHVAIVAPDNSGSVYYNYKKFFSIILFAVCDATYSFTFVDIGSYGSQSDGGILRESTFGQQLQENNLDLPEPTSLPGSNEPFPYYFVGDEAFPLQFNLLRPYPGRHLDVPSRIFNYRLSRARRCIENAFGILVARWRIFHKTIFATPTTVDSIIKATVCLHNYIKKQEGMQQNRKYCGSKYTDHVNQVSGEIIDGEWRQEIMGINGAFAPASNIRRLGARNATHNAILIRDTLKQYVNSNIGSVPWQMQAIKM